VKFLHRDVCVNSLNVMARRSVWLWQRPRRQVHQMHNIFPFVSDVLLIRAKHFTRSPQHNCFSVITSWASKLKVSLLP